MKYVPVICQTDGSFFNLVANKLHFILNLQTCLLYIIVFLKGRRVPHLYFYCPRESFVSIPADVLEEHSITAIALSGAGTLKFLLSPALRPSMKRIWAVVRSKLVALPIQVVNFSSGYPEVLLIRSR